MDRQVVEWVAVLRTPWLDDLGLALMLIGQHWFTAFVLIVFTLVITLRTQRFGWGAGLCVAAVAAVLASAIGKALIDRPRPPFEPAVVRAVGSAMPSSVAVLSAAMGVAAVVGWEHPSRRGRHWAVGTTTAVVVFFGAAVLYLGVHWITDLLVGWVLGVVIGLASVPAGRATADTLRRIFPKTFLWAERFGSDAVVDAEEA